jgi:F-type H+-transporting ATPase subunit delta
MHIPRAARRYANAIYISVSSTENVDVFFRDLGDIRKTLQASAELRAMMASPVLSKEKKNGIIDAVFANEVSAATMSVLHFLVEKNREPLLREIIEGLEELRRAAGGIVVAEVTSAVELDEARKEELTRKLNELTQKHIELSVKCDPAIVGGMVVRLDDTVFDGSVTHRLDLLRRRFLQGA